MIMQKKCLASLRGILTNLMFNSKFDGIRINKNPRSRLASLRTFLLFIQQQFSYSYEMKSFMINSLQR